MKYSVQGKSGNTGIWQQQQSQESEILIGPQEAQRDICSFFSLMLHRSCCSLHKALPFKLAQSRRRVLVLGTEIEPQPSWNGFGAKFWIRSSRKRNVQIVVLCHSKRGKLGSHWWSLDRKWHNAPKHAHAKYFANSYTYYLNIPVFQPVSLRF